MRGSARRLKYSVTRGLFLASCYTEASGKVVKLYEDAACLSTGGLGCEERPPPAAPAQIPEGQAPRLLREHPVRPRLSSAPPADRLSEPCVRVCWPPLLVHSAALQFTLETRLTQGLALRGGLLTVGTVTVCSASVKNDHLLSLSPSAFRGFCLGLQ